MISSSEILPVGTLVLFGHTRGEKTRGKITHRLPNGKYKVEQIEDRGRYPIGMLWTVPPTLLTKIDGDHALVAPSATVAPDKFEEKARLLGISPNCFGKSFTCQGTTYTITNINLNRPKYPVDVVRNDGVPFKFTADAVKLGLLHTFLPTSSTRVETPVVVEIPAILKHPNVGRSFRTFGTTYIVTDFVSRRPKYPYTAKRDSDGKQFKFPADLVESNLL